MLFLLPLLLAPLFYVAFNDWWLLGFYVLGSLLGTFLLWFDQVAGYKYYAEPGKAVQLITRSPLFIVVQLPITIYIITSSGSTLAMGLVLAVGTIICAELVWWRKELSVLNGRFYVETDKQLTATEFTWITRFLIAFYSCMVVLVFFNT